MRLNLTWPRNTLTPLMMIMALEGHLRSWIEAGIFKKSSGDCSIKQIFFDFRKTFISLTLYFIVWPQVKVGEAAQQLAMLDLNFVIVSFVSSFLSGDHLIELILDWALVADKEDPREVNACVTLMITDPRIFRGSLNYLHTPVFTRWDWLYSG